MDLNSIRSHLADFVAPEDDNTSESDVDGGQKSKSTAVAPSFELETSESASPLRDGELDRALECSTRELKKQILIHEQQLRRRTEEFQSHAEAFVERLKQAHYASGFDRQMELMYAKTLKFKARMAELRKLETMKNLQLWHVAKMRREIREEWSRGWGADVDTTIGYDPEHVQEAIEHARAEIQVGFDLLKQSGGATNLEIEAFKTEQEYMKQLAEDNITPEDIKADLSAVSRGEQTEVFESNQAIFSGIEELHQKTIEDLFNFADDDEEIRSLLEDRGMDPDEFHEQGEMTNIPIHDNNG